MIIDVEHHLCLTEQVEEGNSPSGIICERYWDTSGKVRIRKSKDASNLDRYLQFIDEAGIDMAVLSDNITGGLEQMRRWNDFCANTVREHPKRLTGFACVPPLGGKPALDELERAVKELGLKGVHISTRIDGHMLDSRDLWPFYDKVSQLGVPIDVHVTMSPSGFDALHSSYPLYYVMARELDMCATTLRICLGGVLEDFPDLAFIMNHFGGGVSSIVERLDSYMGYEGPGWPDFYFEKRLINKPWREYFDKLYFNMAGREVGMESVKCALTNISPSKLLFATDWPFNFDYRPGDVKRYVEEIRKLDLPEDDIKAMLAGNAARLLRVECEEEGLRSGTT